MGRQLDSRPKSLGMVDTIRLKIESFNALDMGYFNEVRKRSATDEMRNITKQITRTNNKFRKHRQDKGLYTPKFQIEENYYGTIMKKTLVLELSLPKFVFGTNLHELTQADWLDTVQKLLFFLKEIKVEVFEQDIMQAIVTSISYSRNLDITEICTGQQAIRHLAPFNYRPRSDYNYVIREQKNGGSYIKYFNNCTSLIIYDKLPEIAYNPVTAIEKEIAEIWKRRRAGEFPQRVKEYIRVEVSLQDKVSIKQAVRSVNGLIQNSFTFKELFNQELSNQILRKEIDSVFNHSLQKPILLSTYDRPTVQALLTKKFPRFNERMKVAGFVEKLRIENMGLKELRKTMIDGSCERTWFRWQKKLKELFDDIELRDLKISETLRSADILNFILKEFNLKDKKQLSLF